MDNKSPLFRVLLMLTLLAANFSQTASSQPASPFPNRPVTIVVPVVAGGLQDGLARSLAQELSKKWGQPVVVDNRAGASGVIATTFVSKAPSDGYTILISDNASLIANQLLKENLPYNIFRSLTPVTGIAQSGNVLLVNNNAPWKNLSDLISAAKARPGSLNYGSFGIGTSNHIDTEVLAAAAGIDVVHIPFKGGAEILTALIAGDQLSFAMTGVASAMPHINGGRVRAIAYGGKQRVAVLPQVPTIAESGIPNYESAAWFGFYMPAGTSSAVVARVATDVEEVLKNKAYLDRNIYPLGFEPVLRGPSESLTQLNADYARYTAQFKKAKLKID